MKLFVGQIVLVHDAVAAADRGRKFDPRWKGIFVLTERMSRTVGRARPVKEVPRVGRKPKWIFHEDQIQPFSLGLEKGMKD